MSVKDILAKIAKGEALEESEIAELAALESKEDTKPAKDDKAEKALKEAKAAQARILQEKKELKERLEEQEAALEELKSGDLSEQEKTKKDMEKLVKSNEKLIADLETAKTEAATTSRSYTLEKIGGSLKFLDTIPPEMKSFAISNAFKDTEDLSDEDAVTSVVEAFKESHKSVLASDTAASGSGSVSTSGESKSASTKTAEKMNDKERTDYVRARARERSN